MKVIDRETGEEKIFTSRRQVILEILPPIKNEFSLISNILSHIIEYYKDEPLVPYVLKKKDKERLAKDPIYALDIPRFYVKGYDKAVSSSRFDQKLCNEFYERWLQEDKVLLSLVNKKNPTYRVEF